jgi:hypothetical protein
VAHRCAAEYRLRITGLERYQIMTLLGGYTGLQRNLIKYLGISLRCLVGYETKNSGALTLLTAKSFREDFVEKVWGCFI